MKLPSPLMAGSIAIAVFAGGFGVGHFATEDSGSSAKGKPQVLGQVFARNPDASTSTTAATLAPVTTPLTQAPSSPATTAQPSAGRQSSTVTVAPSQTPATSPPATTVTLTQSGDCGNGSAGANLSSQTFPRNKTADTDYETDLQVTVTNGVNKPIQVDGLTVHLVYTDGGTQDVVFNQAIGNVIQPGITNNYGVALNTGKRQVAPDGVSLQNFSFHTEGHPECAGRQA